MTQDGTEVTCSTCVHYRHTNGKRTGLCRRFPPMTPRPDGNSWRQPVVVWDDTCGEWRQRDETFVTRALRVMDAMDAAPIDQRSPPDALAPVPATSGHPDAAGRPARSYEDEVM